MLKKHIVDLEGNIRSHGLDWSISEFDLILASVELKLKTEKIYREYSKKGPQAKAAALKFKSWAGKLIKFADDYEERKQRPQKEG